MYLYTHSHVRITIVRGLGGHSTNNLHKFNPQKRWSRFVFVKLLKAIVHSHSIYGASFINALQCIFKYCTISMCTIIQWKIRNL